jgi:hypothetical protein
MERKRDREEEKMNEESDYKAKEQYLEEGAEPAAAASVEEIAEPEVSAEAPGEEAEA